MKWYVFGKPQVLTVLVPCLIAFCASTLAHNKVVVVPLGDDGPPIKNVIRVSPENGDFKTLAEAMASIGNATPDNPYVILVGPGTYNNTPAIVVKRDVHVIGMGIGVTNINGDVIGSGENQASALITLSGNSSITGLSIENTGTTNGTYRIGVLSTGANGTNKIRNVSIYVQPFASPGNIGLTSYGFLSRKPTGESTEIDDTDVTLGSGGVLSSSFHIAFGHTNLRNVSAYSRSNTGLSGGIPSSLSSFTVFNSSFHTDNGDAIEINNDDHQIIQSRVSSGTVNDRSASKNCLDLFDSSLNFVSC